MRPASSAVRSPSANATRACAYSCTVRHKINGTRTMTIRAAILSTVFDATPKPPYSASVEAWDQAQDAFLADLIGLRGLSPHTREAYARDLQRLAQFAKHSPQQIDKQALTQFSASLSALSKKS